MCVCARMCASVSVCVCARMCASVSVCLVKDRVVSCYTSGMLAAPLLAAFGLSLAPHLLICVSPALNA